MRDPLEYKEMPMENKRKTGSEYENKAVLYLESKGYTILERNYYDKYRRSEIDLIAKEGNQLVFIEVKYRGSLKMGDPAEAVNSCKQQRIRRAAQDYLYRRCEKQEQDISCRFDVVAILGQEIRLIQNAF